MTKIRRFYLLAAAIALLAAGTMTLCAAGQAPGFSEVFGLLRSNLVGVSEAELNRAAVQGLLEQLQPRAWLADSSDGKRAADKPLLSKSNHFEGPVVYLRIGRVDEGLAGEIASACKKLAADTNRLTGVVLDLRFAEGDSYAAAAAAADLFIKTEQPLLDWGKGMVRSQAAADDVNGPVAVLVNRQTAGAAEALAAALREAGAALIIGTNTAGCAAVLKDFELQNGQRLRIAAAPVTTGSGKVLSAQGVKPDIEVVVSPEAELVYFADPFKEPVKGGALPAGINSTATNGQSNGTNRVRRRISEADLIRDREGSSSLFDPSVPTARESEPEQPVVRDPALARALDLLKGLAVVRQLRSN